MTGIDYVKLSGCPKTSFHCCMIHFLPPCSEQSTLKGSSLNPSPIQTKSLKMFSGKRTKPPPPKHLYGTWTGQIPTPSETMNQRQVQS